MMIMQWQGVGDARKEANEEVFGCGEGGQEAGGRSEGKLSV